MWRFLLGWPGSYLKGRRRLGAVEFPGNLLDLDSPKPLLLLEQLVALKPISLFRRLREIWSSEFHRLALAG